MKYSVSGVWDTLVARGLLEHHGRQSPEGYRLVAEHLTLRQLEEDLLNPDVVKDFKDAARAEIFDRKVLKKKRAKLNE